MRRSGRAESHEPTRRSRGRHGSHARRSERRGCPPIASVRRRVRNLHERRDEGGYCRARGVRNGPRYRRRARDCLESVEQTVCRIGRRRRARPALPSPYLPALSMPGDRALSFTANLWTGGSADGARPGIGSSIGIFRTTDTQPSDKYAGKATWPLPGTNTSSRHHTRLLQDGADARKYLTTDQAGRGEGTTLEIATD